MWKMEFLRQNNNFESWNFYIWNIFETVWRNKRTSVERPLKRKTPMWRNKDPWRAMLRFYHRINTTNLYLSSSKLSLSFPANFSQLLVINIWALYNQPAIEAFFYRQTFLSQAGQLSPSTVATTALAARCPNHSARSHPLSARSHPSGANAVVATVLGSIPASSDTVESEGRQMKQWWIPYIKRKNPKNSPFK